MMRPAAFFGAAFHEHRQAMHGAQKSSFRSTVCRIANSFLIAMLVLPKSDYEIANFVPLPQTSQVDVARPEPRVFCSSSCYELTRQI